MSELVLKTSQINNSEGGDISQKGGQIVGDKMDFTLSSEESFFSTDIYKGLYVQNLNPNADVVDLELRVLGGTGKWEDIEDDLTAFYKDDAADEQVQLIDRSIQIAQRFNLDASNGSVIEPEYEYYTPDLLTFYDFLYGRRFMGRPPYNVSWEELSSINTNYVGKEEFPERQVFEDLRTWFRTNIILSSPTRTSLFGQLNTTIYSPSYRILEVVDENTPSYDFGRRVSIPYLARYDSTSKENYWGFYVQVETDFIPDWELQTDFSFILMKWTEKNSITGSSRNRTKLFKISVRGNLKEINLYNKQQVANLYNYYPPYFKPYEDEINGRYSI